MDETRFFIDLGLLFLAALGGAGLAQVCRQPLVNALTFRRLRLRAPAAP